MVRKVINMLCLVLGTLCIVYYLLNGFTVRFGQSMLWVWPTVGSCLILRYALVKLSMLRGEPLPFPSWSIWTVRIIACACLALFLLIEGFVVSGSFKRCPKNVDYLIVLGAKVGSKSIEKRISMAAEYLDKNPDTVCIVSGGQGTDETISEAEYMKDGLIIRGIDSDRVIMEDQSTNTAENIRFSHFHADATGASVALVTNDYHVFRSTALARKVFTGKVYGLPAGSSVISYPHYAVREFFTIVVDTLRGNMSF